MFMMRESFIQKCTSLLLGVRHALCCWLSALRFLNDLSLWEPQAPKPLDQCSSSGTLLLQPLQDFSIHTHHQQPPPSGQFTSLHPHSLDGNSLHPHSLDGNSLHPHSLDGS